MPGGQKITIDRTVLPLVRGTACPEREQDARDVEAHHSVLEEEIMPLYCRRDGRGVSQRWVARMKNAIQSLAWRVNANRILIGHTRECYLPNARMTLECDGRRTAARPH